MSSGADAEPVPITASLDGVVRSLQGGARGGARGDAGAVQAIGGVFGRWEEIVGETVAANVQPIRLDGKRLVVEVADPAWATQMRRLTERLRQRIAEVAGATIDTIEVRVAGHRRGRR